MTRRSVAAAAVSTALLTAGTVIWWGAARSPESAGEPQPDVVASDPGAGRSSVAAPEPATEASRPYVAPDPAAADLGPPSAEELRVLCPSPWSDALDARCADALDARYLDEHVGLEQLYGKVTSRPLGERLPPASELATWREAFADPERTRRAAAEALSRPECLAPEGEPGPELAASCAADEVARLAMLHSACAEILHWYRHSLTADERPYATDGELDEAWRREVDLLDDDASLTVEEYWRRRAEIEDDKFRFAWRLRRCNAVPREAFAWLDPLPTPTGGPLTYHQGKALVEAASRLGDEWAMRESPPSRRKFKPLSPEGRARLRREAEMELEQLEQKGIIITGDWGWQKEELEQLQQKEIITGDRGWQKEELEQEEGFIITED